MVSIVARKANRKDSSDELSVYGDYCIVERLLSSDEKKKPITAIVLKCPYCRLDMASTSSHKISFKKSFMRKLFGLPGLITVTPMLKCPYNAMHAFKIKNGKFIAL